METPPGRVVEDLLLLAERLSGRSLHEAAAARALTPGQVRLLEAHLLRELRASGVFDALARVGAQVRELEAFAEAAA